MSAEPAIPIDAVIFGGGVAGLWLLDQLARQGSHVVLLESKSLGAGQTIASQGIIHGGIKYSLKGVLTKAASRVAEMPDVWRSSLLGARSPNLTRTRLRSDACHLWQTQSLTSHVGMFGARMALRVRPETISHEERPVVLKTTPGTVVRLPEQVIAVDSFLRDLAEQYADRILLLGDDSSYEFHLDSPGEVRSLTLRHPAQPNRTLCFAPRQVIFTAGAGNARLRERVGLSPLAMQRRPLHMLMGRGDLPELNGHCVDGARTRVTVTSARDDQHRTVWQVGGQIAEDGVEQSIDDLIRCGLAELTSVLPGIDFSRTEWSTYRVDRAEGATPDGRRPDDVQLLCAGNVTTGWPTKLVLAPVLAEQIAVRVQSADAGRPFDVSPFADWPRPQVAALPWEEARDWRPAVEWLPTVRRAA